MPIQYKINPELGIAFMFCQGLISDVEFFRAVKTMQADKSHTLGMYRIIDFFSATEDVSLEGMRSVIRYREEMHTQGIQFEHVIILTHSRTLSLFISTMKLMIKKATLKFDATETLEEAIPILGFQDKAQEIIDFYTTSKNQIQEMG